jgi:uncharacterized membrane protein YkoI
MKIKMLCLLAGVALLAGCAETRQKYMGKAGDNDQDVLTGGPVVGTTLNDLPQAVRNALKQRSPTAEVADIDKEIRDGRTVYEISFTEPGKNPKLFVADDGTVASGSQKNP